MSHILVVDDSQTVRKLVEISLRGTTHTADFVASGGEAIVYAKRTAPDLILLDFVLPDMRGPDVCSALARHPRAAQTPVVLMTAKGENVRELFAAYPFVVDYIGKPFAPASIVDVIGRAIRQRRPAPTGAEASSRLPGSTFSFAQKELAAGKLYSRLKASFAAIPRWMNELGHEAPASFFARKILSPQTIEELLEALLPFYRRALAEEEARAVRDASSEESRGFHGHVESWPLADIVTLFGASGRSGELTLTLEERTLLAYFKEGEIRLITTRDPHDYMRGCVVDLRGVAPETLEKARAEQRATGKPIHISVAEAGALPPCDLAATLHARSKRLLFDALESRSGRFRWRDLLSFPAWVDAYGRHVSLSQQRDTLMFGPPDSNPPPVSSLSQIALERLRLEAAAGGHGNGPRPSPSAVFARTQGFSQRLPQFSISAHERKVLTIVDGKATVSEAAARSGLGMNEVALILNRLAAVGLLYPKAAPSAVPEADAPSVRSRPIAILEPDVDGFQRPLESLLSSRADPIDLVDLADEQDLVAAVVRERPRLVILNVEATAGTIETTARALQESAVLEGVPLVAILEAEEGERVNELGALGFHAVLVKPVLYADLERLLA